MTLPVLRSPAVPSWEPLRPVERLHELLGTAGAWSPLGTAGRRSPLASRPLATAGTRSPLANRPLATAGTRSLLAEFLLGTAGVWTPLADVVETGDAYLVEIDVPGVRRRDLDVEVAAGELRIAGEVVEKERVGWLRRRTRRVGRFAYRAALPDDVDADHISADLTDGVLTVRVPKAEHARARRIPVSVG